MAWKCTIIRCLQHHSGITSYWLVERTTKTGEKCEKIASYSLIVSITIPKQNLDIYTTCCYKSSYYCSDSCVTQEYSYSTFYLNSRVFSIIFSQLLGINYQHILSVFLLCCLCEVKAAYNDNMIINNHNLIVGHGRFVIYPEQNFLIF